MYVMLVRLTGEVTKCPILRANLTSIELKLPFLDTCQIFSGIRFYKNAGGVEFLIFKNGLYPSLLPAECEKETFLYALMGHLRVGALEIFKQRQ